MQQRCHYAILVVTIFMVLAISAMWTVPARAEDATPPPAATPSVVQPSETSFVEAPIEPSVPDAAPENAVPIEVPVLEESPIGVQSTPVEEHPPREQMTAHILARLPHHTNVVVLGRS